MRLSEIIRLIRQRLAEWIAPRPLMEKPEWDISSPEEKGDAQLGRAMIERWESRR
jgi:hypothetical protein